MEAFLVITLLTWAVVSVSGTTSELSTTTGDTVNIPCLFGEGMFRSIFWSYNAVTGPQKILSFANGDITIEAEYANRANLQNDSSTLILKEITVADEGTYNCVVDRLKQTALSNIKTKLNVFSLRPDALPMISPCTGADESLSCSIHANQSFTLTCTLANIYPVQDTELIWYQDGKHFSSFHDVTPNDDGTTDISRLIQISETGNFTCNATYLSANGTENTAVSVEAWIIPLAYVPNTPGKNLTVVTIAMAISTVLLVCLCLSYTTRALFRLKARVKTSPTDKPNIDDIIMALAENTQDNGIYHLGKELGFDAVEIDGYVATNSRHMNVTCNATLAMLRDWDEKQFKAIERAALKKALMEIGLVRLADDFFSEEGSVDSSTLLLSTRTRVRNSPSDEQKVTDADILKLARLLPPNLWSPLYVALGIDYSTAEGIRMHSREITEQYIHLLQKWKSASTGTRMELNAILTQVDAGRLVDEYVD